MFSITLSKFIIARFSPICHSKIIKTDFQFLDTEDYWLREYDEEQNGYDGFLAVISATVFECGISLLVR